MELVLLIVASGVLALLGLVLAVAMLAMGGVLGLIVYQSIARKGRWGMNFQVPDCPGCGSKPPTFRVPANTRQAMWGGWTCEDCGTECDKWGAVVEG